MRLARWGLGYASAAAEVLFLIILAVTMTQYWATGPRAERSMSASVKRARLTPLGLAALLLAAR